MNTMETVEATRVVVGGEGDEPLGTDDGTEVTAAQAATLLGVHPRTVRRHIQRGNLRSQVRLEKGTETHFIRVSDLAAFRAGEAQKAADLVENGRAELDPAPHRSSGALMAPKMDPQALVSALLGHVEAQNAQTERLARENGALHAENSRLLAEKEALEAKIARLGRYDGAPRPSPRPKTSLGALLGAFLSK